MSNAHNTGVTLTTNLQAFPWRKKFVFTQSKKNLAYN